MRSQYENIPIISAYAFMMALYPESADGLSLMRGYRNMNTSNIPVSHEELMNVRQRLNIEDPYPGKKDVQIYAGNPDLLFVANILQNFKTWKDDIDKATKQEL